MTLRANLGCISGRDSTEIAEVASFALTCNNASFAVHALRAEHAVFLTDHMRQILVTVAARWAQCRNNTALRAVARLTLDRRIGSQFLAVVPSGAFLASITASTRLVHTLSARSFSR